MAGANERVTSLDTHRSTDPVHWREKQRAAGRGIAGSRRIERKVGQRGGGDSVEKLGGYGILQKRQWGGWMWVEEVAG